MNRIRLWLAAAIGCACLLPASAGAGPIATCVEVVTSPDNHNCHIATTVAGVPVGVVCVATTVAAPNEWSQQQASRCTVTVAARTYDVQNCTNNYYTPGPGGGDNATHSDSCRSGTSGTTYTCNYQDSTPTVSGPPSVYYRETCILRTTLFQLGCADDFEGGFMGWYTHEETCYASVQPPRWVSVYVGCDRLDTYGPNEYEQVVTTTQETCTGRLVTGLATETCTVTPLVDPMYVYYVIKGRATGEPVNGVAVPSCRRR